MLTPRSPTDAALAPVLTPHGHLRLEPANDAPKLSADLAQRLDAAFARGTGHGLLQLGAAETETALPPVFGYWRELGARYMSAVCGRYASPESREHTPVPPPPDGELELLAMAVPPMTGAEYLTGLVLHELWRALDGAFATELAESKTTLDAFLRRKSAAWNLVGRVYFNLAENRHDPDAPFAFLATYTTRLSAQAQAQHLPLGRALAEYAGAANKARLLSLLLPVQRAAEQCPWLKSMVDSGEIFGIEMADADGTAAAPPRARTPRKTKAAPVDPGPDAKAVTTPRTKARARRTAARDVSGKPVARPAPKPAPKPATQRTLSAEGRAAIAERMKRYWAERRTKKPR